MPSWLPSIPYRPAREGYWSPVTSTINWCEEDYYVTIYSAEIVNTLTNLLFVWLGIKGIVNWVRNRHDNIFLVAYGGYLIVGSGSLCFHSTLKYPMQLVDELSMIYTTCLMCFAIFAYDKSTIYSTILGIFLLSLSLSITLYYHYLQEPVFHQVMYALLTAIVLFRSIWLMEVNIRPTLRKKRATAKSGALQQNGKAEANRLSERETARMDARDAKIVKTMWIMVAYGLSVFLGGFAFWALDLKYCSTLRRWRREVGLPWGVVLEGHGWWHLMTGVGGYFYIVWGTWLRHCLNDRQDEFELIWPRLVTSMPVVERKERAGATAANGMGKKEL